MSDARDVLLAKDAVFEWARGEERADAIISALSAMPLASRLALARALVPGWAVVDKPVMQIVLLLLCSARDKGTWDARFLGDINDAISAVHEVLGITAAEEPPHGP